MKRQAITFSLLLIALTNFVVITIDGLAPITAFILYFPVIVYFVLIRLYTRFPNLDKPEAFILAGYLFFVCVFNFGEVRWSSFGYSILFWVFFLFIAQYQYLISKGDLLKISKIIIYLYLINVLLAQFVFRSLQWLFQWVEDLRMGTIRYQGFSSEPSYAAFVVLVAFLIYIRFSEEDTLKSKALVLLSVLYLLKSFSSVYGYILFGAIFVDWSIRKKFISPVFLLIFLPLIASGYLAISKSSLGVTRILDLSSLIITGNFSLENLRFLDGSAFMRVAPSFSYLEKLDLFSMHTYYGNGAGRSAFYFGHIFNDAIDESQKGYESGTIGLGFFPAFLYDYGLVGTIIVCHIVLRRAMCRFITIESLVIFLMLFNANFNTQLFWYVWAMLFVMNQVSSRQFSS